MLTIACTYFSLRYLAVFLSSSFSSAELIRIVTVEIERICSPPRAVKAADFQLSFLV